MKSQRRRMACTIAITLIFGGRYFNVAVRDSVVAVAALNSLSWQRVRQ